VRSDILDCVNAARLAPSAANKQPLEYVAVTKGLERIFECTKWAAYLKDGTPKENEKPTAYIVLLSNTKISTSAGYDAGLAAENLILTALEKGIASCIIRSLDKPRLIEVLKIPGGYDVEMVIALGYPGQKAAEEKLREDVNYWLDGKGVLNVPKRDMKDILHEEVF
jgi:nitroreductase